MDKVKVQMLTEEAFAPFGRVITCEGRTYGGEAGMYNWYEGQAYVDGAQRVSVNLLTAIQRDYVFDKFEAHARTTETVLPLTGPVRGTMPRSLWAGTPPVRSFSVMVPAGMMRCLPRCPNPWACAYDRMGKVPGRSVI